MQLVFHAPSPAPLTFSEGLLDSLIETAVRALRKALSLVRASLPWRMTRLQTAYGLGDMPGILAAVPLDELSTGMREAIQGALVDAARAGGNKTLTARLIPRFDIVNPHVVQWAHTRAAAQVTLIDAESRAAIQSIIERAVSEGIDARSAGRMIRDYVGLNSRQAAAVANYRAGLIEAGVKPSRIEDLVAKATNRAWRQRAEMIARTEIQTSANFGQLEAWKQSAAKGLLDPARTRRIWIANSGACAKCVGMAAASRENPAQLSGSFVGDAGTFGAPPLHPDCRCSMGLEFL